MQVGEEILALLVMPVREELLDHLVLLVLPEELVVQVVLAMQGMAVKVEMVVIGQMVES